MNNSYSQKMWLNFTNKGVQEMKSLPKYVSFKLFLAMFLFLSNFSLQWFCYSAKSKMVLVIIDQLGEVKNK